MREAARGRPFDEVGVLAPILTGRVDCKGVMVDVGAHSGTSAEPFLKRGWHVWAFEPDPSNRAQLMRLQERYHALHVDARAVTDRDGDELPFYRSSISTGISGLSAFHGSHKVAGYVRTVSLATFLKQQAVDHVDFLKVDVEGFDLFVLRGLNWASVQPTTVVCEFEDRKTLPLGHCYIDLADFLSDHGYGVLVSEWHPIVEYGMEHRWRGVFRYPAPLADPDGWGNLVASKDEGVLDDFLRRAQRLERKSAR